MYTVVGCGDCSNLWIVKNQPNETTCTRCGKRWKFRKRKKFVETDDLEHAQKVRSNILEEQVDGASGTHFDS